MERLFLSFFPNVKRGTASSHLGKNRFLNTFESKPSRTCILIALSNVLKDTLCLSAILVSYFDIVKVYLNLSVST